MAKSVNGKEIQLDPNSKPFLAKRLIADGFDTVLLFGLFMLLTAWIMATPLAGTYTAHYERYSMIEIETAAAYNNDAARISEALSGNEEYRSERFAAALHSYILKAVCCLAAELVLFLVIPLLRKDRATVGKILTGVMPFHLRRQARAEWYQILYRFLFIFIIDSLALYLFTGIWTFVLVPVIRLSEMLLNRNNRTVCDGVTGIMIIEKLSYNGIN